MNNDNPLIPQGSLLEQKTKSRSRVKTAFFCVLAVHVLAILTALIAQGCKREQPPAPQEPLPPVPTFEPASIPPAEESNVPPPAMETSVPPPPVVDTAPPPVIPPPAAGTEHVVAKGDSFYSLGKKYGVSMKAIAEANPGVDPAKLQIGQKLNIPAPVAAAPGAVASPTAALSEGEQVYVVKSGDNLTKIAARFGTTVRALRSVNNLRTDRIKVGDKLKVPAKAAAPVTAPEPAPNTPYGVPGPGPAAPPQ